MELSRSSVLEFINAKDFANAAKSFALWNKGDGKVLPGLVKEELKKLLYFEVKKKGGGYHPH